MAYSFPVFLDLTGVVCAVIGGNDMAAQKIAALARAGARVRVFSPQLTPACEAAVREGHAEWMARAVEPGDLKGCRLAIAANQDPVENSALRDEARREGVWLNALDDPPHCDFIFPSIHQQGELIVAVSTGGACPALAVRLRERFGRSLGPAYAEFLTWMRTLREPMARSIPDFATRRALWYEIVDSRALALMEDGEPQEARAVIAQLLARHGVRLPGEFQQPE